MIDICLLGTGGNMPMPYRFLASSIISYLGRKILIDAGEGTQVAMRILGRGFKSLDVICITHCHGDHIIGLTGLLSTIGNSGRLDPITIIGPEGIKKVVEGLNVINPYLPYQLNIIENPSMDIFMKVDKNGIIICENEKDSNIVISTMKLEHSSHCIGYSFYYKRNPKFNVEKATNNNVPKVIWNRLQKGETIELEDRIYTPNLVLGEERNGIKISYITDTRPIKEAKKFIENSNLFICEGTYGNDDDIEKAIKNKHMTFREAATLAKESSVDRLVLTHFSPAMTNPEEYAKNCLEVHKNSVIGNDGMIISLNFQE
ncbi:ribonuclease Z [Hathewaya limosa]|uniref:Ribonuclease Z n=1 Tax=Hathewaya limosa TaxID=1536 RepID=A0ABU0JNJ7_HATLI|nr:ribonuclease Z [Hathewaya limosa]MDQ0478651.1 ribonuclease Z [Hathewaya limosa]